MNREIRFEDIADIPPYSLDKNAKSEILTGRLRSLTELHRGKCVEYGRILDGLGYDLDRCNSYYDIPFIPTRLFKELEMCSVGCDEVIKTMTSSGTTGQKTSKIYLDRNTAANQQKAMIKIVSDFIGSARLPMIIIDCPSVIKNRRNFSARGAGILGFSVFAKDKIYALDDEMGLNVEGIEDFVNKHKKEQILLFGFTFIVWEHFYQELLRLREQGIELNLSNAVLIHGGGWKKLSGLEITPDVFKESLEKVCGLKRVHDYYGMVEQTGCIYMECECGHMHASIYSDIITRHATDFSVCEVGEEGIIQAVSVIPESYPGHNLLTEDKGVILGEDDCPCGRKGKYFRVLGRIKNAEIRGCSDTYATEYSG